MDFKNNIPIYRQITDHFYEKVLNGQWKSGERIPSVREVAVSLEVNPNTAVKAYEELQSQGIIYNKRGIGYFVTSDGYEKVLEFKQKEFKTEILPSIFKQMDLLKISIAEVENLYQTYQNKHYEDQ